MSGRESVLVNGMLLRLTAKQVAERFDQIVEFSEIEKVIDAQSSSTPRACFMR